MILNSHLPLQAWRDPQTARLPGVRPVAIDNWLTRSDSFAAQMAYRRELIREKRGIVFAAQETAYKACRELRDMIKAPHSKDHPLIDAASHVQEDLCILQKQGDEHVLSAGVMCFPSSWDLGEKIGRSIADIHTVVPEFSPVQSIVERMLSAIRVEQPLGRANFLIYTDPELHQPRREGIPKPIDPTAKRYVRVERQTFRRVPETRAIVFAIHTYIILASRLNQQAFDELALLKPDLVPHPR